MNPHPPSQNWAIASFLMTDIVGSTVLWESFPDEMPQVIERHDQIGQAVTERHGGRVVKSRGEGDSLFCVFDRPSSAIASAADLQRELAIETWPGGIKVRVRCAIHTGEVQTREGDYFGTTLSRCARIREVAHGDQIVVSYATVQLVKGTGNQPFRDLGVHRLRDLEKPEHLFQLLGDGLVIDFPAPRSLTSLRNNLPAQVSSFVGRTGALETLGGYVKSNRLVSACGAGGSGKTRLAIQLGATLIDLFEDGVWLISLAEKSSGEQVVPSIADALGYTLAQQERALDDLCENLGRTREILLILDNAEHLTEAVAAAADSILRRCPHVRILVTSREPLGITGETTYRVPTLQLPAISTNYDVEAVQRTESVTLFCDRASARLPGFSLRPSNVAAVVEIVNRVDGIPLAIEMAAPLVATLSPKQICDRLNDRFRLLTNPDSTALPRHRTLEAMIESSFDLLEGEEQVLLTRLSVFPGTFTLAAVEQICSDERLEPDDVLRVLQRLVEKSLVQTIYDQDFEPRFRLLETINQYASRHLGDKGILLDRLFQWSRDQALQADVELIGPNQAAWLERLEQDRSSIRLALDWGFAARKPETVEIVDGMRRFWMRKGYLVEGLGFLERALQLIEPDSGEIVGRLHNSLGVFCWRSGNLVAARNHFETAMQIAEYLQDAAGLPRIFNNLGLIATEMGDYDSAADYYHQSILLSRETGQMEFLRIGLLNLGLARSDQSRIDEAEVLLSEALDLAIQSRDEARIAMIQGAQAGLCLRRGDGLTASALLIEAFTTWRRINDPFPVSDALLDVSILAEQAQRENAVVLLGCYDSLIKTASSKPTRRSEEQYRLLELRLRECFGEPRCRQLIEKGRSMVGMDVVEFALRELNQKSESFRNFTTLT